MNHSSARKEEFERVAMAHTERLLRAALRLTRDRDASEDLVQETLLQAWRAFDQFERGTNCKAWLFRILLNLSSKRRQKLQASPTMISLEAYESAKVVHMRVGPEHIPSSGVFAALDGLAEEQRAVLILAVVEGFTCKEIAGMCGVPIGTVMSRLSRARASLRKTLSSYVPHREPLPEDGASERGAQALKLTPGVKAQ